VLLCLLIRAVPGGRGGITANARARLRPSLRLDAGRLLAGEAPLLLVDGVLEGAPVRRRPCPLTRCMVAIGLSTHRLAAVVLRSIPVARPAVQPRRLQCLAPGREGRGCPEGRSEQSRYDLQWLHQDVSQPPNRRGAVGGLASAGCLRGCGVRGRLVTPPLRHRGPSRGRRLARQGPASRRVIATTWNRRWFTGIEGLPPTREQVGRSLAQQRQPVLRRLGGVATLTNRIGPAASGHGIR
jgi:hypothetical protein